MSAHGNGWRKLLAQESAAHRGAQAAADLRAEGRALVGLVEQDTAAGLRRALAETATWDVARDGWRPVVTTLLGTYDDLRLIAHDRLDRETQTLMDAFVARLLSALRSTPSSTTPTREDAGR